VQHALRAFTPDDQKALTRTARTYPKSGVYDIEESLTSLGTGEAIVTVLSERGAPTPVAWTRLRAPRSLMAAIGEPAVTEAAHASPLWGTYGTPLDRESAYEKLSASSGATSSPSAPVEPVPPAAAAAGGAPAGPAAGRGRGPRLLREGHGQPHGEVVLPLGGARGRARDQPRTLRDRPPPALRPGGGRPGIARPDRRRARGVH
jgi:hypothetical protein